MRRNTSSKRSRSSSPPISTYSLVPELDATVLLSSHIVHDLERVCDDLATLPDATGIIQVRHTSDAAGATEDRPSAHSAGQYLG